MSVAVKADKVKRGTSIGSIVANYYTVRFRVKMRGWHWGKEPELCAKLFVIDKIPTDEQFQEPPFNVPTGSQVFPLQSMKSEELCANNNPYLSTMNSFVWPSHLFE